MMGANEHAEYVFSKLLPNWLSSRVLVAVTVMGALLTVAVIMVVTVRVERQLEETRALGTCLVDQMSQHRFHNWESHRGLADQHEEAVDLPSTGLPPPPDSLLRPKPREHQQLREVCRQWLSGEEDP